MASKNLVSTAVLLSLNLVFFNMVSSTYVPCPPPPKSNGHNNPPATTPATPATPSTHEMPISSSETDSTMASKTLLSTALFLSLNLIFFTMVSSTNVPCPPPPESTYQK
ncbi:14 kDa proline-rich protein DC2.15-like [Quillaja saponaria]|uniref:14 kDa proline-rich protein DC2.15-like n=1 Tax=Quillaja saponaria TaxID=32244 RepID=A0AAD7LPU1_QUISA|nr:14 kDa proline-rich protein DC2.15-like [Quillaja saponaria]